MSRLILLILLTFLACIAVLMVGTAAVTRAQQAQKAQQDERWTCTFVGGEQKAAILQFGVETGRRILWKITKTGLRPMLLMAHNELGVVASFSSIDDALPSQRAPIEAETVVIDRKTGTFTYSGTSPVQAKNWVYQGKCTKG